MHQKKKSDCMLDVPVTIAPRNKSISSASSKPSSTPIRRTMSSPSSDLQNNPSQPIKFPEALKKQPASRTPISTNFNTKSSKALSLTQNTRMSKRTSSVDNFQKSVNSGIRMTASSRFSKNLLPTWLAKSNPTTAPVNESIDHSLTQSVSDNPQDTNASESTTISQSENDNLSKSTPVNVIDDANSFSEIFEDLLNELNMKESQKEKLRQLPHDRKLYLLQQNQHIKKTTNNSKSSTKSIPSSNSTTSLFQPKTTKQKASLKKSETSARLSVSGKTPAPLKGSEDMDKSHGTCISSSSPKTTKSNDSTCSTVSKSNSTRREEKRSLVSGKPSGTMSKAMQNMRNTRENIPDGRAATYKFSRKNLANFNSTRSKVGSMIMEFDALAYKQEDAVTDESAAWLLLDNTTLPRHANKNNQQQRPSLNNLFSKPTADSDPVALVSSSYVYQSLTRRDASHLANLVASEDRNKLGRDRDNPYFYVEKLRNSRNLSIDALTRYIASLKATLNNVNESWVNEFLSKRHDGLDALETVFGKLVAKKTKKKGNLRLTESEEQCLLECIHCIHALVNYKAGYDQIMMRPELLHILLVFLFASTASLSLTIQTNAPPSKKASLTNLGSQLLSAAVKSEAKQSKSVLANNAAKDGNSVADGEQGLHITFEACTLVFGIFFSICLISSDGYELVLLVLSEVKDEKYRFEKLLQSLYELGSSLENNATKPSHQTDDQYSLMVFNCITAGLNLCCTIVQTSASVEKRSALREEIERRGLKGYIEKLLKQRNMLPAALQTCIDNYMKQKKVDEDQIRKQENLKRQSILQFQPHDMMASALNSFQKDPELYYLVVDSVNELMSVGVHQISTDKQFVKDVWYVVHTLAKHLKPIKTNDEIHFALRQFIPSIEPVIGKLPFTANTERIGKNLVTNAASDAPANVSAAACKSDDHLEDIEGLRNMVEELKESVKKNQESMAKIRREKNELLMKVSKAAADIKERDERILAIEAENQRLAKEHQKVLLKGNDVQQNQDESVPRQSESIPSAVLHESESTLSLPSPPPPPPPPPPPFPSSNALSMPTQTDISKQSIIRKRNLVRKDPSNRSSRYLHPLALNLCFSDLKSLQKNSTSTSLLSTINNLTESHQSIEPSCLIEQDFVKRPAVPMKQFFWSKLSKDKINNTVWEEIFEPSLTESMSSDSSSDELEMDGTLELDTIELERLFKKNTNLNNNNNSKNQQIQTRKQHLITLLEFNRANNIAIMLAKIKLPYSEIRDAIWNIDDAKLTIDNLIAIRQYIPTKEEIEIVKEYQGDVNMLGNAERYFRAIMYIPRLADRLNCMIFRRRFDQELQEILPEMDIIQLAVTELKESKRFKHVLKTVLAIGNYLNGQTVRGNAVGFHIDALLKMRDTKAEGEGVSNVPTLLHYLVHFLSKSDDDVLNFKQDISHLAAAAKLSPPTIFASVNALGGGLVQIKEELSASRRKVSEHQIDRFVEAMEEFVLETEPIIEDLKHMAKDVEDKLKEVIMYYGEDPTMVKSEEFFQIIASFSDSFEKAQTEIHEARERALRRQRQVEIQQKTVCQ